VWPLSRAPPAPAGVLTEASDTKRLSTLDDESGRHSARPL
jgi:hypothetical protein